MLPFTFQTELVYDVSNHTMCSAMLSVVRFPYATNPFLPMYINNGRNTDPICYKDLKKAFASRLQMSGLFQNNFQNT